MRVLTPAHRCVPFDLVFFGPDQSKLDVAATMILSTLLVLLLVGILILGFDSGMFKRKPKSVRGVDVDSAVYIQAEQQYNPDRTLIYYGGGLLFLYVNHQISIILIIGSTTSKLHFGCFGIPQYPSGLHRICCITYQWHSSLITIHLRSSQK